MTNIVQILRSPAGGIRKHVLDILDNLSNPNLKQIFITNTLESDIDLSYLSLNPHIEIFHVNIKEKPGISDLINLIIIFKILFFKKVDVIHGHGAKGGMYARILAFFLRVKCLYTPHGGSLHRVHGELKNKLYDFIEKCLLPLTDVFLFESFYTAETYTQNIGDPASSKALKVINYNGVDIPSFKAEHSYHNGEKLKLASFGLLRHLKGHDIVIDACAALKNLNIPFSYFIYGHGDFESSLKSQIKQLKLEEFITIVDYSGDVCREMTKYDFILHPSRFESFGYVPVEAMSVGVPVITSHHGGLKEVVNENCGYIAYNNTPKEYATILENFYLGKTKDLEIKIKNALSNVENKFTKKRMLSTILFHYS